MKRWLAVFAVAVALGPSGCSEDPPSKPVNAALEAGRPQAHELYTHCGIYKTEFEGKTWYAAPPLVVNGNPPAGWDNPYAAGTFRVLSEKEAVFVSQTGRAAHFSSVPGPDTGPEQCD